jgi:hypothetical protein
MSTAAAVLLFFIYFFNDIMTQHTNMSHVTYMSNVHVKCITERQHKSTERQNKV